MTTYGTVQHTEPLTPRLVRVVLGGDGLADFTPTGWTDEYVNAQFLPDDSDFTPPFDLDAARKADADQRPAGRRYTVRARDEAAGTITLDFVVHGDIGRAGRWANHAQPGDRLQFLGPNGGYRPDPAAPAHLFAGDESALPAIAASLAQVPEGVRAEVVVVVDDAANELDLASPADLHVTWLHREDVAPDDPDQLLRGVTALDLAPDTQVFVHGEAAEVRSIRTHLVVTRGFARDAMSISPYWRRGKNDEQWRAVKRDWLAESDRMLDTDPSGTD